MNGKDMEECSIEELISRVVNFMEHDDTKLIGRGAILKFSNGSLAVTLYFSPDGTRKNVLGFEIVKNVTKKRKVGWWWWKKEEGYTAEYVVLGVRDLLNEHNEYDFSPIQDFVDKFYEDEHKRWEERSNREKKRKICEALEIMDEFEEVV